MARGRALCRALAQVQLRAFVRAFFSRGYRCRSLRSDSPGGSRLLPQTGSRRMLPTILEGAQTHNLKSIDLELIAGEVVAITGVSGAGNSSLAMDTLYAEGQRRFVESFSPYARQFLERLERPPMKRLEPIPAGIAVDRRAPIKSSRSTIATMADLEPYLSALFLREARPVCPEHGFEARALDVQSAARSASQSLGSARGVVTYPVRVPGTEAYLEVREGLLRDGYRRLWLDGKTEDLDSLKPSLAIESGQL